MKHIFTKTKKELENILKNEIDSVELDTFFWGGGIIGIQCGHFPLIHDEKEDKAIPAIFEDIEDEEQKNAVKLHPYMGYFPLTTWKFGVSLVKYAKERDKNPKIIILVNDWQWVKKVEDGQENPYKEKFYKQEILPVSYFKELKKNKIGIDLIMPFKNQEGNIQNKFFFSEQRLRNRYKRYYAATCPLNNKCAHEYLPLLIQLEKEGVKLFISFAPRTCFLPVNAATESFKKSPEGNKMKVINIFADGIFKNIFWEKVDVRVHD